MSSKLKLLFGAVVVMAVSIGLGFAVPMGKAPKVIDDSQKVVIYETTYRNGIPDDVSPADSTIDIMERYKDFFEGTEFKDLYMPGGSMLVPIDRPTKSFSDEFKSNQFDLAEPRYYNNRVYFWNTMVNRFVKLKRYTYTLTEVMPTEKMLKEGWVDNVPHYYYHGVGVGIREDGTEGTLETQRVFMLPTEYVLDKRGEAF